MRNLCAERVSILLHRLKRIVMRYCLYLTAPAEQERSPTHNNRGSALKSWATPHGLVIQRLNNRSQSFSTVKTTPMLEMLKSPAGW
jgi:hypothetical protein